MYMYTHDSSERTSRGLWNALRCVSLVQEWRIPPSSDGIEIAGWGSGG